MYKVYVTDHVFDNLDPEFEILREAGAELVPLQCKSSEELIEKARDADALLNTYFSPIDGTVMDAMEKSYEGCRGYNCGLWKDWETHR